MSQHERIANGVVKRNEEGTYLHIQKKALRLHAGNITEYLKKHHRKLSLQDPKGIGKIIPQAHDNGLIIWDLETTGLGHASSIFMASYCEISPHKRMIDNPEIHCLFARDYAEEKAVVKAFYEKLKSNGYTTITYNGHTFDIPKVGERLVACGLQARLDSNETVKTIKSSSRDLLKDVRKIEGKSLGDKKLQTVEKLIFGYTRIADVSGERISREYKDWMYGKRNGDTMERIINHGFQDIATTVATALYYLNQIN